MAWFLVIKRYKYESPDGWEYSEDVTYHDNYEDADVEYHNQGASNTDTGKGVQEKDIEEKMICEKVKGTVKKENNNELA